MAVNSVYSSGYGKIFNNFNSKAATSGSSAACPNCGQAKSASCPTCGGNSSSSAYYTQSKANTLASQAKQTTANCPTCKPANSSAYYSPTKPNTSTSTAKSSSSCPTCPKTPAASYNANSGGARLQSATQKSNWLW